MALNKCLVIACVVFMMAVYTALAKQDDTSAGSSSSGCATPFQWDFAAKAYVTKGNTPTTCESNCHNCHGNCCATTGICPTSSCNANDLGGDNRNCKGDAKGALATTTLTQSSSDCPVADTRTRRYGVICDINAYKSGCSGKCLGRLTCVAPNSRTRIECDADVAEWEGVDCFQDGNSANFKVCGCEGNLANNRIAVVVPEKAPSEKSPDPSEKSSPTTTDDSSEKTPSEKSSKTTTDEPKDSSSEKSPSEKTSSEKSPSDNSSEKSPSNNSPSEKTPSEKSSKMTTDEPKDSSSEKSPSEKTSSEKSPSDNSSENSPSNNSPSEKTPSEKSGKTSDDETKDSSSEKSPSEKTPSEKSPSGDSSSEKTPSQKSPSEKTTDDTKTTKSEDTKTTKADDTKTSKSEDTKTSKSEDAKTSKSEGTDDDSSPTPSPADLILDHAIILPVEDLPCSIALEFCVTNAKGVSNPPPNPTAATCASLKVYAETLGAVAFSCTSLNATADRTCVSVTGVGAAQANAMCADAGANFAGANFCVPGDRCTVTGSADRPDGICPPTGALHGGCGECQPGVPSTTPHSGNATIYLGRAACFVVLASSTITSSGSSKIQGNLGVWPGTAVTGILRSNGLAPVGGTGGPGVMLGGFEIYTPSTGNSNAADAQLDLTAAYNNAAGRLPTVRLGLIYIVAREGATFGPGVYNTESSFAIGDSAGPARDLTLDAHNDPDAVFIFQVGSTLVVNVGCRVVLANGAAASNVFWQVGSSATLLGSTVFEGTIMAMASISTANGATGAVVHGRLLARNGAVTFTGAPIGGVNNPAIVPPLPTDDTCASLKAYAESLGNVNFTCKLVQESDMKTCASATSMGSTETNKMCSLAGTNFTGMYADLGYGAYTCNLEARSSTTCGCRTEAPAMPACLTTKLTVNGMVTATDIAPIDGTSITITGYALVANVGFKEIKDCAGPTVNALKSTIATGLNFPAENVTIVCWQLRRSRALLGEDGDDDATSPADDGFALASLGRSLVQECVPVTVMRTTLDAGNSSMVPTYASGFKTLVDNDVEGACPLGDLSVSTNVVAASTVDGCDVWKQRLTSAMPPGTTAADCEAVVVASPAEEGGGGLKLWIIIVIAVLAVLLPLLCCCILFVLYRRRKVRAAEEQALADKVQPIYGDVTPLAAGAAATAVTANATRETEVDDLMEEGSSPVHTPPASPMLRVSSRTARVSGVPRSPSRSPASVMDTPERVSSVGLDWRRALTKPAGEVDDLSADPRPSPSMSLPMPPLANSPWGRRSLAPINDAGAGPSAPNSPIGSSRPRVGVPMLPKIAAGARPTSTGNDVDDLTDGAPSPARREGSIRSSLNPRSVLGTMPGTWNDVDREGEMSNAAAQATADVSTDVRTHSMLHDDPHVDSPQRPASATERLTPSASVRFTGINPGPSPRKIVTLDSIKSRAGEGADADDDDNDAPAAAVQPASFFDRFRGFFKSDSQTKREREAETFKRPGNFGDLGDADREVCAKAGLFKPAITALDRFFKRGAGGDLSDDDAARLRAAGFDTANLDAVRATARFFQRGAGAGELSDDEAAKLKAMDVDDAQSAAALARLFKRPGGFRGSGDDVRDLAAAGVDAGDADKIAELQRVFRRPGGFGDLSNDEAARLAMAGVDVTDPAAARAMSRMFKRGGAPGDLSDAEQELAAAAGVDVRLAGVAAAVARAFARPGGFGDLSEDDPESVAMPGASEKQPPMSPALRAFKRAGKLGELVAEDEQAGALRKLSGVAATLSPTKSMARRQVALGRGSNAHADADEDFNEPQRLSTSRSPTAEAERRRRELLAAGRGPQYGDKMIGDIDEMALGEETRFGGRTSRPSAGAGGSKPSAWGGIMSPSKGKVAKEEDVVAFSNASFEK
ncbi:hypothetical protein FOA52_006961 [Chlamydomonas sp. UWO 241]|nr:hypothetical protein FOA52_006961 [Chlamydomonas sp. UWO 241]